MTVCPECDHEHTGARWAYICIGCPCPLTSGRPSEPDVAPAAAEGSESSDAVVAVQADGDHAAAGETPGDLTPYELTVEQCVELAELMRAELIRALDRWTNTLTGARLATYRAAQKRADDGSWP